MNKKASKNKVVKDVVEVIMENNQPVVSSLVVAELFKKRHDNVLQSINELEIPDDYRVLNFQATFRDVPGPNGAIRKEPAFNMTRDGFSLLAMGFTGKKAMEWKIKFLEAFNAMEAKLKIVPPQVEANIRFKKAKPEAVKSFEGAARYWCYLENISWEQGKRQIEGEIRVSDIYEMDKLALDSAWTYLNMCLYAVPPKMRGVNACSAKDLETVHGLLDYWAYCGNTPRKKLLASICKVMGLKSLKELPKSHVPHAISLIWEGINKHSGKVDALKEASH
ncbi:Rha family transcriptional regulator [Maridesulfovibrio hydrothermalis]|uniref:Phage regulatory protein, Rha family n=1 Tax=Maridesulfovibrio hydrothermalis AM13 = DSM 14728 TaxID=1121451 RepID=L0RBC1_9BACT|nr:Rha family transcriptional regulator [Maridesulfovibrio hydrothermalis]CCO24054.1 Phage regulatory protein, Rha family [Maridesulfovibrio hydrothermalis AM13 = DSM 14728]